MKKQILKNNCQFRYTLEKAKIVCPNCSTEYTKYPNKYDRIEDFKCDICDKIIIIPQHYIDTYHNKQCRIVKEE